MNQEGPDRPPFSTPCSPLFPDEEIGSQRESNGPWSNGELVADLRLGLRPAGSQSVPAALSSSGYHILSA